MASLAEIRAKLKAQDDRASGNRTNVDNTIYPQWNIKEGMDSVIRFLPDADLKNDFFWVERAMINLPFNGIAGQADNRKVTVRVPCMDMYGEQDPILNEIRPWWNDETLKATASIYWKKRSYLFQGLVVEDGLKEENPPENPIRRFIITPQIFQLIRAALVDPELDHMPTDYVNGIDFRVSKTLKGKYADYSTSKWSRKSRALTDYEMDAIQTHGLFNLSDFLPKKPTDIEQRIIKEMFEASVDGEAFDMEKWGQYFKPYGANDQSEASSSVAQTPAPAPAPAAAPVAAAAPAKEELPWDDEAPAASAPVVTAPVTAAAGSAQDILAKIRSRQTS